MLKAEGLKFKTTFNIQIYNLLTFQLFNLNIKP